VYSRKRIPSSHEASFLSALAVQKFGEDRNASAIRGSRKIETRDATADAGDEVRGHGADTAGNDVGGVEVVAVGAVDGGNIADGGVGYIGDIEHADVHGYNADDGRFATANIDATVIA
jgi:hypothetical protein